MPETVEHSSSASPRMDRAGHRDRSGVTIARRSPVVHETHNNRHAFTVGINIVW